ncbi:MAG: elongation factor P [Chloroflexota bacterium]
MAMVEVQTLRARNIYEEGGNLWAVKAYQHIKVARGGATIRLTVRNLRTGTTIEKTYNNGTKLDRITLDSREAQYLYVDGDGDDAMYNFMDIDTYDQFALPHHTLIDILPYLKIEDVVELESHEGEILSVEIPNTVELEVTWAEAAVAGNTASSSDKEVEVETGYRLRTPMFVKEGDILRIDTRSGEYVTRVK